MKFTKIRQLVLATFAVCGLALGGRAVAHASTQAPSTVTMELHKLDNNSEDQTTETIKNTGDEVSLPTGVIPYDADKYGKVTYSVYDLTDVMKQRGIISGEVTSEAFEAARTQLLKDITDDQTDPKALLAAQEAFVKANGLTSIADKTLEGQSSSLTFPGIRNSGFYLIMETVAPTHHLTKLSAPLIIGLPLSDKATIHLYPKNLIARDVDPEIHKVGRNPENPTSKTYLPLGKVEFTLAQKNGEGEVRTLKTDKNGDIEFGGLEVGIEYVLTESANKRYPWYQQADTKKHKLSLTFTVDKDGNIKALKTLPNRAHFDIQGTRIGIKNDLILGGAEFKKVDAQTEKGLAGAKFKVQKISPKGKTYWAVFKGKTFVKWVTSKAAATELTSAEDGTFDFTGVPYVYDQRHGKVTYNLVETQAPAGYALLKEATPFEINEETNIQTIKNESYALPTTGGMGIWLFLLIGSLLMGGAGYLYYRQRKAA
ncbi:SpaA isopeptide-forming pilin-related protein [Levilactobacillus yonginensis]|uniref:SpaA isopeptide-forming pilin-related protein n=1 Tax=Levilactobacillus yonginensis TaxID=1054041 RepID=UPI000F7A75DB|nr:SpaA isopeptide-forming pilin-related protein [Levilactobacillus yonginensis]